jgi:hypothetical protein
LIVSSQKTQCRLAQVLTTKNRLSRESSVELQKIADAVEHGAALKGLIAKNGGQAMSTKRSLAVAVPLTISIPPVPRITELDMSEWDGPLTVLLDPEPHTKLGQQFARLEQHGMQKVASAVKACGRTGEKWTYECGKSAVRRIVRSHRRFCCKQCDKYLAAKLFQENRLYGTLLDHSSNLHLVSFWSANHSLSSEAIRSFEDTVIQSLRRHFKGSSNWGFKSMTHYDPSRGLLIVGIVSVPQGSSIHSKELRSAGIECEVGPAGGTYAFDGMLYEVLRPRLTVGHGVLRADLMRAFFGGNHLRSLGVFYGQIAKNKPVVDKQNLRLNATQSGVGSQSLRDRGMSTACPYCGTTCARKTVSREILSDVEDIPWLLDDIPALDAWERLRKLKCKKYHVVRIQ